MTIESFKHFFCVAQGNTFMNAAEECNISQSSLSKSIQRLEHELGVMLFDRRARSAKLTPAGKALFADLQKIAPAFDEMLSRVRAYSERKRIACCPIPVLSGFNSMVSQFTKNNPTISVDVRRERDYRRAFALLASGELDFLFLHRPLVRQSQCTEVLLFDDCLYAVMPPDHPLAKKPAVPFLELLDQPLLMDDYIFSNIKDAAAEIERKPTVQLTLPNREENFLNVAAGQGIALYYESDIYAFKLNKVAAAPVSDFPHQPFVLAYSKRLKMSIEHLLFKEHMISSFSRLHLKENRNVQQVEKS
jgi:DNA-binding transcriptional LysR family regulator